MALHWHISLSSCAIFPTWNSPGGAIWSVEEDIHAPGETQLSPMGQKHPPQTVSGYSHQPHLLPCNVQNDTYKSDGCTGLIPWTITINLLSRTGEMLTFYFFRAQLSVLKGKNIWLQPSRSEESGARIIPFELGWGRRAPRRNRKKACSLHLLARHWHPARESSMAAWSFWSLSHHNVTAPSRRFRCPASSPWSLLQRTVTALDGLPLFMFFL